MGIDIKVVSKTNESWNTALGLNAYCNWAWGDINWRKIFELISFNITILYDNNPNYWSNDQLKDILSSLIKLKNKDIEFYNHKYKYYYQDENLQDNIEDDINKLIEFFTEYVDNDCIIVIY
jgi:hypothetical protein